jgi:hypothetical protein
MYRKEGTELCTSVLYAAVDMYRKEGPRVLTLNTVLSQSPFYGVKLLYDYGFWSPVSKYRGFGIYSMNKTKSQQNVVCSYRG